MCGIIGFSSERKAPLSVLLEGLKRLEYRGYDSAGLAWQARGRIRVVKRAGKVETLWKEVDPRLETKAGISHTRWATHGAPTDRNAHPQFDETGKVMVVHNGVIDNYRELKDTLIARGHRFSSDTDTEVLAHLIAEYLEGTLGEDPGANGGHAAGTDGAQGAQGAQSAESSGERFSNDGSAPRGTPPSAPADRTGSVVGSVTAAAPPETGTAVAIRSLEDAVCLALRSVDGAYGIAVLSETDPGKVVAARKGSPLAIGIGADASYVASDVVALAGHADKVVHLEDGDIATLVGRTHRIQRIAGGESATNGWQPLDLPSSVADKRGYAHFMLKEIMEQPEALKDCYLGRVRRESGTVRLGGLNLEPRDFLEIDRVRLLGCGTSYIAASVGARMIEELARIEASAEYAPEYRYRNPIVRKGTLFFAVTQSGETADTLLAMREVQRKGGRVFGIVNRVASSVAREAGAGVYIHAGFEYAVASTKTMLNTMMALFLFALLLGRMKDLSFDTGRKLIEEVERLPEKIREVLGMRPIFQEAARKFAAVQNLYYMGRGYSHPVAMEGALKLKEIAYVHAEAYSAAEMKHGPIALINDRFASCFVIPRDSVFSRTLTNLEEVRARRGPVLAITTGPAGELEELADQVICLPETEEILTPFLTTVAVQLFAYESAVLRGCPIDQPKNLAKSVTVE